jgi:hypothetical protein
MNSFSALRHSKNYYIFYSIQTENFSSKVPILLVETKYENFVLIHIQANSGKFSNYFK